MYKITNFRQENALRNAYAYEAAVKLLNKPEELEKQKWQTVKSAINILLFQLLTIDSHSFPSAVGKIHAKPLHTALACIRYTGYHIPGRLS